jgi:hypothetical protein
MFSIIVHFGKISDHIEIMIGYIEYSFIILSEFFPE